jgi:undecaprenyl-diphosphatase
MFVFLEALLLGILEGLTELLPISSTGHLIVVQEALNFKDSGELFTVVIQLGAALAITWYFRVDLWNKVKGLFRGDKPTLTFWKYLAIGTVPAGIIGLLLDNHMDTLTTPAIVASMLIAGGVILYFVDRKPVDHRAPKPAIDFGQLSLRRALVVGTAQCVAIVPGVSRSGATIVGGLAAGLNRPTAAAFSFYLSIPVLVLASCYKLVKYGDSIGDISGGAMSIGIGMLAAFVTALLTISWLLRYISHHSFRPFAYYRIALGLGIFVLLGLQVL